MYTYIYIYNNTNIKKKNNSNLKKRKITKIRKISKNNIRMCVGLFLGTPPHRLVLPPLRIWLNF